MEYENHYADSNFAKKGVAGTALGIAIGAGALSLMNNGGLGNLFGGCNNRNNGYDPIAMYALLGNRAGCNEDHCVNRYEAAQSARIAELETEVKLRDANTFTMGEMGKLRDYVDGKFASVEREICDQRVFNTATTAALNCTNSQVAQLMALTKLVVPIASICPTPAVATPTTAG